MCPEPALLVAYLDGTLFHRDARAVDEHLLTCASCTALLEDMRRQRDAEAHRSRRSQIRMMGLAVTAIAVVAIGVWAVMPGAKDEAARPAVAGAGSPSEGGSKVQQRTPTPTSAPKSVAIAKPISPAPEEPTPAVADGSGLVLRGRNANRRIMWRVRDLVIEHSADGGATWVTEHTADRPIRAGAFVDANVAWLVGENGLVLRRTPNGWFGTTPPVEGHLIGVRASSPSKATVTLDDGRNFDTVNGGVTWSSP